MESTRNCCPNWRAKSRSVVVTVSVTAMSLPSHVVWRDISDLYQFSLSVYRRSLVVRGKALDLGHHAVEDLQAGVPETRVRDVEPDPLDQLVRPGRPAGAQKLEVVLDESWPRAGVTGG